MTNYYLIGGEEERNALENKLNKRSMLNFKSDNLFLYILFLNYLQIGSLGLDKGVIDAIKSRTLVLSLLLPKELFLIYLLNQFFNISGGQAADGILEKLPESESYASAKAIPKEQPKDPQAKSSEASSALPKKKSSKTGK